MNAASARARSQAMQENMGSDSTSYFTRSKWALIHQGTLVFNLLVGGAGEFSHGLFQKWDVVSVSLLSSSIQQQNSEHCWCFTFFSNSKNIAPFIAFHLLLNPDLECYLQPQEFLYLLNLALPSNEYTCNTGSHNAGICPWRKETEINLLIILP